jgi:NAD(P)-dependent dehydrogenase (short-subunit alcohol dehydrogenase family)
MQANAYRYWMQWFGVWDGGSDMSALSIITGTRSGLGKSIYEQLLALSQPCVSIARTPAADSRADGSGHHIQADLAQRHDWPALLAPLLSQISFDRLYFFDNAAILPHGEMLADDYGVKLDEAMTVNVTTPMQIADALADAARSKDVPLDIVHISSGAAHQPIPNWAAYCATKAAAAMQWRVLEQENHFITAHIVQPGVIATGMQAKLRAKGDPIAPPEAALRSPDDVASDVLRQCGIAQRAL